MKYICMLFVLFYSLASFGGILVSPMDVEFAAGKPLRQDVVILNPGNRIEYVGVVPSLVKNPGTKKAQYQKIKNPRKLGLLISPAKLIIPPKQSRLVRVVLIKPFGKAERVYRLVVRPVLGKLIFAKLNTKAKQTVGIKVIIAYGVRVIVRPKQAFVRVQLKRDGREITASNKGNASVVLQYCEQCARKKCINLKKAKRLYAGNIWKFTAPYNKAVSFQQAYRGQIRKIISN